MQSNFTTSEQSKRLLELGVPVNSADCYYSIINKGEECHIIGPMVLSLPTYLEEKDTFPCENMTPCWSVGRLLEIYCKCTDDKLDDGVLPINKHEFYDIINGLCEVITQAIWCNKLDFSKLNN